MGRTATDPGARKSLPIGLESQFEFWKTEDRPIDPAAISPSDQPLPMLAYDAAPDPGETLTKR